MVFRATPVGSIALHLAPSISQDSPACSQDHPRQPNLDSTWPSWSDFLRFGFHSGSQIFKKPSKTLVFFLVFSLTAKKPPKSSKIDPKSFPNQAKIAIWVAFGGLLRTILALLDAIFTYLGVLGRHLGSSSGSWAPSCCQRCRNTAPTGAKTTQIRANIAQNDS